MLIFAATYKILKACSANTLLLLGDDQSSKEEEQQDDEDLPELIKTLMYYTIDEEALLLFENPFAFQPLQDFRFFREETDKSIDTIYVCNTEEQLEVQKGDNVFFLYPKKDLEVSICDAPVNSSAQFPFCIESFSSVLLKFCLNCVDEVIHTPGSLVAMPNHILFFRRFFLTIVCKFFTQHVIYVGKGTFWLLLSIGA